MKTGWEQRSLARDHSGRSGWLSLALVLALLVLASCSKNSSTDAAKPEDAEHATATAAPQEVEAHGGDQMKDEHGGKAASAKAGMGVGQVAPAFSLTTLSGGTFAFPTGKPTAVWFTANGCRPCIPKAKALDSLKATFGERLAVLGVDINPTETEAVFRSWLKEVGNPRFEAAMDNGGQLAVSWGVTDTSTVVITDAAGKVAYHSSGQADEGTYREALRRAGLS